MDFSLIIFLIIAWTVFSSFKGRNKGVSSHNESARDTFVKAHAKIRETASQTEFGARAERPQQWNPAQRNQAQSNNETSSGSWGEMTPTQRGRERARQNTSYPGAQQNFQKNFQQNFRQGSQQSLQQRLDAATKTLSTVRNVKEFKQGSERKVKRQQIGRGKDFGLSSRHAPQKDQNRHRRDDWGQRGGGEIITTKSLLVLLALGTIVIYVLSQVSPSDLGL